MTSPAILSRMTNKTMVPNGEGFGGFAALTQTDVAHGLVGLAPGPTCLMRAIYCLDHSEQNLRAMNLWAWQGAMNMAIAKNWDVPKHREALRTMAKLACAYLVFPFVTNCPHCNGSGAVQPNQHNPDGICRLCNGDKRFDMTDEELSQLLGFTESEWANKWSSRFRDIRMMVNDWHDQGCRNVNRRLRD